jgi:hypothetical protein
VHRQSGGKDKNALDGRMCQFHIPTTLFPHKKFRTYCIKEWVRTGTGVDITVKRNISDPDRNQNPACNFTDGLPYCFISN